MSEFMNALKKSKGLVADQATVEKKQQFEIESGKCLIRMKCSVFNDEEIGIILGENGRFKQDKDGPGGTIYFNNKEKSIHYDGVVFFQKELERLFEKQLSKEQLLHVYLTKKTFGSSSMIIEDFDD